MRFDIGHSIKGQTLPSGAYNLILKQETLLCCNLKSTMTVQISVSSLSPFLEFEPFISIITWICLYFLTSMFNFCMRKILHYFFELWGLSQSSYGPSKLDCNASIQICLCAWLLRNYDLICEAFLFINSCLSSHTIYISTERLIEDLWDIVCSYADNSFTFMSKSIV